MPKAISAVYAALLLEPNLSEEHQKRIFAYAKANRDEALLEGLLGHPALIEEIDSALAANLSDYRARARWFKRPGRSPEKIQEALAAEKSTTVLAALASQDLPPEAYRQLAKRSGVKLSQALLDNPRTPPDVRVEAAANWSKVFRLTNSEAALRQVRSSISGSVAELEKAVEVTNSPTLLASIACFSGLPGDLYEKIAVKAFEILKVELQDPPKGIDSYSHMVRYAGISPATSYSWGGVPIVSAYYPGFDPLAVILTQSPKGGSLTAFIHKGILELVPGASKTKRSTSPRTGKYLPASSAPTKSSEMIQASDILSQSYSLMVRLQPFDIKARVKAASSEGWAEYLSALKHPGATPAMANQSQTRFMGYAKGSTLKEMSLLKPDVLTALLASNPQLLEDNHLKSLGRPVEMVASLLKLHNHPQRNAIASRLVHSRFLSEDSLLEIPVRYLAVSSIPLYVHQMVGRLLTEHLGEDPAAWEIFESLSDEFEGTFAELLNAADALA